MNDPGNLGSAFAAMPTREDFERGFVDATVEVSGEKLIVRLSTLAPDMAKKVLLRYLATENPRDLIRPIVAPEFAKDDFLDALSSDDLRTLGNKAATLLAGPDYMKSLLKEQGIL